MNFPDRIPADELEIFLKEFRLAGGESHRYKETPSIILHLEYDCALYTRAMNADYTKVENPFPDEFTTKRALINYLRPWIEILNVHLIDYMPRSVGLKWQSEQKSWTLVEYYAIAPNLSWKRVFPV